MVLLELRGESNFNVILSQSSSGSDHELLISVKFLVPINIPPSGSFSVAVGSSSLGDANVLCRLLFSC